MDTTTLIIGINCFYAILIMIIVTIQSRLAVKEIKEYIDKTTK